MSREKDVEAIDSSVRTATCNTRAVSASSTFSVQIGREMAVRLLQMCPLNGINVNIVVFLLLLRGLLVTSRLHSLNTDLLSG